MPERRPENKLDKKTLTFWRDQIVTAEQWSSTWRSRGNKIINRYRDDDRSINSQTSRGGVSTATSTGVRYNILYANTDTMLPVLYSEIPKPEGRATNRKDMAARAAADMMERVLEYSIEADDFNYMMQKVVKDLLLPGLGIARVKIDTAFSQEKVEEKVEREDGEVEVEITEEDRVALQSTTSEYVNWNDFIFPETSDWDDLPWLAFRGRSTLSEATELFGADKANMLSYTTHDDDDGNKRNKVDDRDTSPSFKKATIYEIWDKEQRQRLFISKDGVIQQPLEVDDDPLELTNFFPVPRPLLSVTTNDTTLPVPLFILYQDQADELDIITARITGLIDKLRKRGVYDAAMKELNRLNNAADNEYIPIKDFARFTDKGGLNAIWASEDITSFAGVLIGLYQQRDQILNIIFQIVGISDIQRAVADPRETAAAQRLKARYGTLRISRQQRDVQRFIRDLMRLQFELVINSFSAQVISTITGLPVESKIEPLQIQDPQTGQMVDNPEGGKVIEFGVNDLLEKLKDQEPPSVIIDIETDSTLAKDDLADREQVVEFNRVITEFAAGAPALQQVIGTDATSEMLLSLVRRFSMGRSVEQAIIDQVGVVKQQIAEREAQPSPEELEAAAAQAELQLKQAELQQEAQQDNIENQLKVAKLQLEQRALEIKEAELGLNDNIEQQKVDLSAINTAIDIQKATLDEEKFRVEAENPDVNVVVGV